MNTELLKRIGLTDSEAKVYIALLELGDSTRGQIVHQSGIAGSKIYEIMEKLHDKGLVSLYVKNNVKHFNPINPQQILSYIEDQKQQFSRIEKDVMLFLPNLLSLYNSSKEEQEVELLQGLKGLDIVFKEQIELLNSGDTCYVIGGTKGSDEHVIQAFFQKVHLWREHKKIRTKMLFNLHQKESTQKLYSSQKYPSTQTRFIDHTSPVAINIYYDRTVIIIFGRVISAIHIKSRDVAHSFQEYFNLLWSASRK